MKNQEEKKTGSEEEARKASHYIAQLATHFLGIGAQFSPSAVVLFLFFLSRKQLKVLKTF
jgi:hypothetical protein